MERQELERSAFRVLDEAWQPDLSCCLPNPATYPHLWLWDSCFHSMAWAALGDGRAVRELEAVFRTQFANGFVPHMTYRGPSVWRGPRDDVSCFTQPPVHALAAARLAENGLPVPAALDADVTRALRYLLEHRLTDGLATVVHPWETGCDDSPRWDSWVGSTSWDRVRWTLLDRELAASATWADDEGDAIGNPLFEAQSSLFNGILAHALELHGRRTADEELSAAGARLGGAMELLLWDEDQGLYVDRALVGGGPSVRVPTLDGVLATLGTVSRERAAIALDQLRDPARFAGPHGLRYVPADHPAYRSDQYWRGPAWPQLTLLAVEACRRWGHDELAAALADQARRSIPASGWSEYWDPETGRGLGARPQTWAAVAVALQAWGTRALRARGSRTSRPAGRR
jgi:hypothetical protein